MKLSKQTAFLIAAGLIVVGGFGALYLGLKSQPRPATSKAFSTTPIDSLVGAAKTINDINTSGWKTFVSQNGSYSYQYPPQRVKINPESNSAQSSYLQFSDNKLSKEDSIGSTFYNPTIVMALDNAEYSAFITTYDHLIEKKDLTIDGKEAHEDIYRYIYKGKINYDIIYYFDEFAAQSKIDARSNTYKSNKYGFGLIWIGIYPKDNTKVNTYILLAEKIVSTLRFLK